MSFNSSMLSVPEALPYMVGGLLYAPAINTGIADKLAEGAYPSLTSMAFCLEDSIMDCALEQAEQSLCSTLAAIKQKVPEENRPMLFVRVRTPSHLERVHELLKSTEDILTGYILPKFDSSNGEAYARLITEFNRSRSERLYFMPIIESRKVAMALQRIEELLKIRSILSTVQPYILNIRVGGNDFSNIFGVRRPVDRTIFDLGIIRNILLDISSIFSADYVVSGAVWEYFDSDGKEGAWSEGLKRELSEDRLNGFIGKTAIHPAQLPFIYDSMRVTAEDYRDAMSILGWESKTSGVAKSADGGRMNEVKCHTRWARKIKILGDIYGIKETATV